MKNVLIISDAFLNGGLETRVLEQVNAYHNSGLKVFFICNSSANNHEKHNFDIFSSDFDFIPQNGQLKSQQILTACAKIVDFCKKYKIDFIECQPFWCLLPATIAAEHCQIPISYTLHGTASGNFIEPIYFEAYLLFYLCLSFGLDQIFAVSERLARIYSYASNDIFVSNNSITLKDIPRGKTFVGNGHYAIASRLDIPKTIPIKEFLPQLCDFSFTKQIDIYGDGDQKDALASFINEQGLSKKVKLLGWHPNLQSILTKNNYDCVFGIGRVITDTIASATPAGILGYGGFAGLLNKDNLQHFAHTNFISWDSYDKKFLEFELRRLYKNPHSFILKPSDLSSLDAELNWKKHIEKASKVKFAPKPIINNIISILNSHPTEDLFLDKAIINQLMDIIYNVEQNQLIYAGILQNYYSIIKQTNIELIAKNTQLENSFSWKITKPLRKIRYLTIKKH